MLRGHNSRAISVLRVEHRDRNAADCIRRERPVDLVDPGFCSSQVEINQSTRSVGRVLPRVSKTDERCRTQLVFEGSQADWGPAVNPCSARLRHVVEVSSMDITNGNPVVFAFFSLPDAHLEPVRRDPVHELAVHPEPKLALQFVGLRDEVDVHLVTRQGREAKCLSNRRDAGPLPVAVLQVEDQEFHLGLGDRVLLDFD